jgi:hypothetical protein
MITIGSNYLDAEPSKNSGSKTTWPPSPKTTKVLGMKREAKDSKTARTVHLVLNDPRIAVGIVVGTVAEEIAVEIAVAVMGSDAEVVVVAAAVAVAAVAEEVAVAAEEAVAVAVDAVQTAATVDKTSLERRNSSKLRAIRDPFLNGLFCPLKLRL